MHSSLIGKVEKANRYARELDRISIDRVALTFRGDNDTHHVSLDAGQWRCTCHYFESLGQLRPPSHPPEGVRRHASRTRRRSRSSRPRRPPRPPDPGGRAGSRPTFPDRHGARALDRRSPAKADRFAARCKQFRADRLIIAPSTLSPGARALTDRAGRCTFGTNSPSGVPSGKFRPGVEVEARSDSRPRRHHRVPITGVPRLRAPSPDDTLQGREAGVNPAQSRYGDHRLADVDPMEVRSPTRSGCSTFERKGRHRDAIDRLRQPLPDVPWRASARPLPNPTPETSMAARRFLLPAVLIALLAMLAAACGPSGQASPTPAAASASRRPARRQRPPRHRRPPPTLPGDPHRRRGHRGHHRRRAPEDRLADPRHHRDPVRDRRRRPRRRQGRGHRQLPARGGGHPRSSPRSRRRRREDRRPRGRPRDLGGRRPDARATPSSSSAGRTCPCS